MAKAEVQKLLKEQHEVERKRQETIDLLKKNDDTLQETRRLELKLKDERVALEAQKRDFETEKKGFSALIIQHEANKKDIYNKLSDLAN